MNTGPERPPLRPIAAPVSVWFLVILCVGIELILQASDRGFGPPVLRFWAYELAGFRPRLLANEDPRFFGQTTTMFVSYAVLHIGIVHLLINMVTLLSLGTAVVWFAGTFRFLEVFFGSAIAGAILYAFFPGSGVVMVGASGGLFGLAGALLTWETAARIRNRQPLLPIVFSVGALCALNLLLWIFMDGQMAWQGHLGGLLAGIIFAIAGDRAEPHGS